MIYAALAVLGLCFGSFVNAVVWRTKQQAKSRKPKVESLKQFSIFTGRSQCVHCGHKLAAKDLLPVLSWLALRGRCRYCKKPISWQYPIVELTMAAVFVLSYVFWFNPVELVSHSTGAGPIGAGQSVLFITWLVTSAGLAALAVYDWRHMLLPNRLLYPTFFVAFAGRLAYIAFFVSDKSHSLWLWFSSLVVASGIFFVIYFASREKAIGFGDVRLGLITGTVLADPALSLLMLFSASLLGTIIVLPALVTGRKKLTAKIPYGPFLIAATWLALLFGNELIDRYRYLFLT